MAAFLILTCFLSLPHIGRLAASLEGLARAAGETDIAFEISKKSPESLNDIYQPSPYGDYYYNERVIYDDAFNCTDLGDVAIYKAMGDNNHSPMCACKECNI